MKPYALFMSCCCGVHLGDTSRGHDPTHAPDQHNVLMDYLNVSSRHALAMFTPTLKFNMLAFVSMVTLYSESLYDIT